MASKSTRQQKALMTASARPASPGPGHAPVASAGDVAPAEPAVGNERRRAVTTCAWCGEGFEPKARGRIPKWCSASCRQRAWEQARAASSGLSAVQVVERLVQTPVPIPPTRRDWPRLLSELTAQLDSGRIYNRDLDGLSAALAAVNVSMARRTYIRSRTAARPH